VTARRAVSTVAVLLAALQLVRAEPLPVLAQEPPRAGGQGGACDGPLRPPAQLGDGWETGGLEAGGLAAGGLAAEPIVALLEAICSDTFPDIHSVLLAHRGTLVFEAYFPGHAFSYAAEGFRGARTEFGPEIRENVHSVSKSVTGLLVGIARDRGHLPDIQTDVFSFFPEHARLGGGAKAGITVQSLLLMASGLSWNEQDVFYSRPENDIVQLHVVDDPLAYILGKDLAHPPMTEWYYNGGGAVLAGDIVRRTSGQRLEEFAQEHLFGPLGIEDAGWTILPSGVVDAAGGVSLRPRDMAKLGQLVLDGGTWRGQRIVSGDRVKEMTSRLVQFNPTEGYGYFWWTRTYPGEPEAVPSVRADGWGGQWILVFPTLDLVAVFTGGSYGIDRPPRLDEIVTRFIIPAASGG
jgi:CubicO group peptidase (beta-lactamase class C family)